MGILKFSMPQSELVILLPQTTLPILSDLRNRNNTTSLDYSLIELVNKSSDFFFLFFLSITFAFLVFLL